VAARENGGETLTVKEKPMMTLLTAPPKVETLADLIERLGDIPLARVRMHPAPGMATEDDVLKVDAEENLLCELVDGVLVEKATGWGKSFPTVALMTILHTFVRPRNLGLVTGVDGMMRLFPGLVRIPDVAFVSWARIPGGQVPTAPIPALAPDLAVEVLSPGNTRGEMERKLREYFAAGVQRVWLVDPRARTVAVYTGPEERTILNESDTLIGDPVLPGFTLVLRELFAGLDRRANP
jgi:Uma2 family endonuclease